MRGGTFFCKLIRAKKLIFCKKILLLFFNIFYPRFRTIEVSCSQWIFWKARNTRCLLTRYLVHVTSVCANALLSVPLVVLIVVNVLEVNALRTFDNRVLFSSGYNIKAVIILLIDFLKRLGFYRLELLFLICEIMLFKYSVVNPYFKSRE